MPGTHISVVVPAYNPGRRIDRLLDSLARQTMPPDRFEVVVVDDGSTDGTGARLDAAAQRWRAAGHADLRVIHQENSGWPGWPRNVGLAAARGEYVFFADDDDWFADDALAGLDRWACEQDADIVLGKMVGVGRNVPVALFRRTLPDATLANAPLADSLTAHKLFRRSMLLENDIRFPEGERRLEDHVFVVRSLFASRHTVVAADRDYYFHSGDPLAPGISSRTVRWPDYFAAMRESLDVVRARATDPRVRDRMYRRWMRVEICNKLMGNWCLHRDRCENEMLFDAAREVVREYFGPGVDAGLDRHRRLVAALLRDGTAADTVALARFLQDGDRPWLFTDAGRGPGGEVLVRVGCPGCGVEPDPAAGVLRFPASGTAIGAAPLVELLTPSAEVHHRGSPPVPVPVRWAAVGLLAVGPWPPGAGRDGDQLWIALDGLPGGRVERGRVRPAGAAHGASVALRSAVQRPRAAAHEVRRRVARVVRRRRSRPR